MDRPTFEPVLPPNSLHPRAGLSGWVRSALGVLLGISALVGLVACGASSANDVVVSYVATPVVVGADPTVPLSPTSRSQRRPTRLPTSRAGATAPATGVAALTAVATDAGGSASTVDSSNPPAPVATNAAPASDVTVASAEPTPPGLQTAAEIESTSSATPLPAPTETGVASQTPVLPSATSPADVTIGATAGSTPILANATDATASTEADDTEAADTESEDGSEAATAGTATPLTGTQEALTPESITSVGSTPDPTPVAGQVSAATGLFVTSNSKSSKYYYARDDSGWHRIRADHQVWFATAAELLRAFPNRKLHPARTARATRTPTPTAILQNSGG